MHIDHLTYLVTTVDMGSMTTAAHHLHVTSQAISKAIKEMERHFGHAIITREGRNIKPTALGLELAALARPIVESYEDFEAFGMSYTEDGENRRAIRLGIPITVLRGSLFDESQLGLFQIEFPDVSLELFRNSADSCLRALERGLVDATISVGCYERDNFFNIRIGSLRIKVLARKDHPAMQGSSVDLPEISQFPVALPEDLRFVFPALNQQLAQSGHAASFKTLAPTPEAHWEFLDQGGLVLTGRGSPLLELADTLCERPLTLDGDSFALPLYLIYPRDKKFACLSRLQSTLVRRKR